MVRPPLGSPPFVSLAAASRTAVLQQGEVRLVDPDGVLADRFGDSFQSGSGVGEVGWLVGLGIGQVQVGELMDCGFHPGRLHLVDHGADDCDCE